MDMQELIGGVVWDDFSGIYTERLARYDGGRYDYKLSEETFRLDFAVALARQWEYAHHVFVEYPCDLAPSQKLDLFVQDGPGYCFEFKFFRQIPSKRNPPYTQHLGSLWADLVKLHALCRPHRARYLVVVADDRFQSYFVSQSVLPMTKGATLKPTFDISRIQKTALDILRKRLARVEIPDPFDLTLINRGVTVSGPFQGHLVEMS